LFRRAFRTDKEILLEKAFHNAQCALPNVYLASGVFREYSMFSRVVDMQELHECLAKVLVCEVAPLDHHRFRFLRETLGLSHREMATALGVHIGSVRRWEKPHSTITGTAERLVRLLILMKLWPAKSDYSEFLALLMRLESTGSIADRLSPQTGFLCLRKKKTWECNKVLIGDIEELTHS
jgi:DNA-binding transcriptional regulator YiaG